MSVEVLKRIWPEWQIEGAPLGKGSYGVVYKAVRRDHNVESYAAIKVISIPSDPSEVESLRSEGLGMDATRTYLQGIVNDFVSEIQLMESLKGVQNIVSVEDYKVVERTGEIGWDIYIRMELLTPFNAYMGGRKMTEKEVIKLGCDICTALEICAQRNIIHRDIKPENIFINDFGFFKLGDFGIARKMENLTGGLSQKGTFNYMAPEVANSSDYDARVDTYSLGIVLYRLLNGNRLPFLFNEQQLLNPNERRIAVERRIRGERLPAPCEASPAMADVILRACAHNPNMRFASATELKHALLRVANGTYQMYPGNLDRTAAVRRAPADLDRTTAVRRAPVAPGTAPGTPPRNNGPVVNTFGTPPKKKKKSKAPLIIAGVLALVALVGTGVFLLPKLLGDQEQSTESTGETTDTTPVQTVDYSKFDDEQIAAIITEADDLAAQEDFEGALTKVQIGLVTYPDSALLQQKSEEYTEALARQAKDAILAEAESYAEAGDYVAAMAILQNAQEQNGEDADFQAAYDAYEEAYLNQVKADAISQADTLAAGGKYPEAIVLLEQTMETIGEDKQLQEKIEQYKKDHVQAVIKTANAYADKQEFANAYAVLQQAMQYYPDNQELQKALADIQEAESSANPSAALNPNQNPVMPKTPEEHEITGATTKKDAVEIQREDLYHASFTTEDEYIWYKFTTSVNYSAYSIEILNNSINTTLYFTVYDAFDNEIKSQSVGKGESAYLDVSLEANTEYWLKVYRYYDNRMGNYQFSVKEKICDAGMTQEEAFYTDLGVQYTKSFDVHQMYDWYRFTTTSGYSTYQFRLTNNSIDTTLYLRVYDEYDTELGSISVSKGSSDFLDLKLSPNREYTIRMSRYYDTRNGYYQMAVHEMPCDAGLSQEEAFPLPLNQPFYGTADTTFAEWYVFTFQEDGTYTLKLTNNSINTTVYATVYDVLGTELGKLSASQNGSQERSMEIPAGTILFVKISRYYSDRFGNYTLLVS